MKKRILTLATILIAAVSSQSQIINAGFETWATDPVASGTMDPNTGSLGTTGWWDFNALNESPFLGGSPASVFRDASDVHGGTYSAKIVSVVLTPTSYSLVSPYNIADTMGILFTGNVNSSGASLSVVPGEPFTQRITEFDFYFKYFPKGVDTAACVVTLRHHYAGVSNQLGAGAVLIHGLVNSWTMGQVSIHYDSTQGNPDSIFVEFTACNFNRKSLPKPGDSLLVDDVSTTIAGINEVSAPAVHVNVYPNPASTEVNFKIYSNEEATRADIYDLSGRMISSYPIHNNSLAVKTEGYASGMYICQIFNGTGTLLNVNRFSVSNK